MQILSKLKKDLSSSTNIEVLYHRYLNNLDEEEQQMRDFSEALGFTFMSVWAFMMPLEKVMKFIKPDSHNVSDLELNQEDLDLIASLALPLTEMQTHLNMPKYSSSPCTLKDNQLTLDCEGNVQLCCAVYDSQKYNLGKYTDIPLDRLQEKKNCSSTCKECMALGLHKYVTYEASELELLALWNVGRSRLSSSNINNKTVQMF